MTSARILIECFGLPGCGKTTMAETLAPELGYWTTRDVREYWHGRVSVAGKIGFVCAVLTQWRIWRVLLWSGFTLKAWRSPDALYRLATLPFLAARLRRTLTTHGVMADQLLVQECWSVLLSAGNRAPDINDLADLMRALYAGLPTRLVFFDTGPSEAAIRLAGRTTHAYSRFDGMDVRTITSHLERTRIMTDRVVEAARAAGLDVAKIDASGSRAASADAVRAILNA
jgi:hypothetical protein